MESLIVLKKKDFAKNAVGRYLWNFFSSSKTWDQDKKIIIDTKYRWKHKHPLWNAFNAVLQQLREEGTTKIIIK